MFHRLPMDDSRERERDFNCVGAVNHCQTSLVNTYLSLGQVSSNAIFMSNSKVKLSMLFFDLAFLRRALIKALLSSVFD